MQQLLKMRREEKLDVILLARFLERQAGTRYGVKYSKNAGCHRDTVYHRLPRCYYLVSPEYKCLRDGVIFYYKGWGWRVRSGWRDVIRQIECTNKKIYVLERTIAE